MSWTTPRTWVTNEVVTASLFNTHIRDNLLALPHSYFRESGDKTVVSTVTETSLFSAAPTITGGDLGANGSLYARFAGVLTNNAVGTLTLRVKLGASTLVQSNAMDLADSASACAWLLEVWLENEGSASAQHCTARWTKTEGTSAGAGTGVFEQAGYNRGGLIVNTGAVNTASDQVFDVSAQWSASSASLSITKQWANVIVAQG